MALHRQVTDTARSACDHNGQCHQGRFASSITITQADVPSLQGWPVWGDMRLGQSDPWLDGDELNGSFPRIARVKQAVAPGMGMKLLLAGLWPLSVQFSHSVVSDSYWPHELQHASPPCPSSTPRVHPNPVPLSRWCHPTSSSSVIPFSPCPQSFPASVSFQLSQLFGSCQCMAKFITML